MKFKHYLLIAMMGCMAFIVLVSAYWSLDGLVFRRVFDRDQITLTTDKDVYKPGETVTASYSLCTNREIRVINQWSLLDTYLRTYPKHETETSSKECVVNKSIVVETLSVTLPEDEYVFSGTKTIVVNPLRSITVSMTTNKFKVQK